MARLHRMKIGDETRPPPTALYVAVTRQRGAIGVRLISTIAIPAKVPFSVAERHQGPAEDVTVPQAGIELVICCGNRLSVLRPAGSFILPTAAAI